MRFGEDRRRDELFKSFYDKYYRRMIRFFIRAFHVSEEDAEELAQDSFIRFHQAMDEYRGDAEWGFLEVIARNVGLNRVRARAALKREGLTVNIDGADVSRAPAVRQEPPDYAAGEQAVLQRKQLHDAIAELPAGQRQCLQLWLEDFQYGEIANALLITEDAVRSRLRDARRTLKARLGDDVHLPEEKE